MVFLIYGLFAHLPNTDACYPDWCVIYNHYVQPLQTTYYIVKTLCADMYMYANIVISGKYNK